jgi:hypothetical protein
MMPVKEKELEGRLELRDKAEAWHGRLNKSRHHVITW